MKVFITGICGLLGQKLTHTLAQDIYDVAGCDLYDQTLIPHLPHQYYQVDLRQKEFTLNVIKAFHPDVIVHTAAMTDVDGCELNREACWQSNVVATHNVVSAAQKVNARLIFISTDYVFNGRSGPYREEDPPDPINYYGRSKLAAENLVRGSGLDHAIIRTIVLYGYGRNARASFVTWLLNRLRNGQSVRIVNDQWGNTTLAEDLAMAIERVILLGKGGLYNVGGRGYQTRYEFALTAAQVFGLDPSLITPISTAELGQSAPRPLRSGLVIDKAEAELFITFHTPEESLRIYKQQEELG